MPSMLIYFAIVPVVIWCFIVVIVEFLEKGLHHQYMHKWRFYIICAIVALIIALVFVILGFTVKLGDVP